ncbi:MAG: SusD/RagB family nutrient-binding outer membrane lipoprotein [Bacteroidetes bacterium]|nr:SusD/RagB family nutrient-binding outer membrane lipoprotein [Bacteroidota bacterium]
MKTYMKIKIFTVFSLALLLMNNACTDHFEELNTPNNLVTEDLVNIDLMFTLVQYRSIVSETPNGAGTIGNYCGYATSCANRPFQSGDSPGVWNSAYGSRLNNLSEIIRLCQKDSETAPDLVNKKAIARIMKVWVFAKVTDTYGDIPYFESCLPQSEAVYRPKYDTQKSIYEDFFKELKEAAAELDESKESYGSADLMYGGDVVKWKKLANSLRLRLALRVRYADAALATANMSDLTEADLITTMEDDAYIYTCTDFEENQNALYNRIVSNQGQGETGCWNLGKTMLDILIGNGDPHNPADPRIGIYADTAKATWIAEHDTTFGYRGHPVLGYVPVEIKYSYGGRSCSERPPFWFVAVIERPILRCSEVYFSLAEAALFGLKGTSADANAYYQLGIDRAIEWSQDFYNKCAPQMHETIQIYDDSTWTDAAYNTYMAEKEITQAEVDAFKLNAVYTLSGTQEEQLEQLINQKVVALHPLEYQGWAEWRRTGYPRVLVGPDTDHLLGVCKRRMMWPNQEQQVNSDSYAEALARLGVEDNELAKVWWDVNPAAPHEHPGEVESRSAPWVGK